MALAQVPRRVMEMDLRQPVEKQLKQAGIRVPQKQSAAWQKSADAVTHLAKVGVLHPSVVAGARQRLLGLIRDALREM